MEFDATSNLSQISNQSDDIKSTISSISGLSTYQDEFADLRHLVNPEKYPANVGQKDRDQCSTPVNDSGCDLQYEDRIADLSYQLQSTLKQNEHYKNELYNLEIKFEVKYHDKIEELLRINNKLEIELVNANEQIQRLIKNYASKNETQLHKDNGFITIEKKYHQLSLENSNLERKYIETNRTKKELEYINQKLRIDFNDCKVKIDTNNECIKQLKEKISQQFVEIQMLTKGSSSMNQRLTEKNMEVEQVKNILQWYKKQLENMQNDKKNFIEDIAKYRSEIVSKTEKIDCLTLNLKSLENKFELFQLQALKEKEKLFEELKQSSGPIEIKLEQKNEYKSDQPTLTYYENSIDDLKNEIKSVKCYMKEQEEIIKNVNKENANLISRCVATQKMLQNKNLEIEEIDLNKRQLQSDLKLFKEDLVKKNIEIESLKNENNRLETEISSCKEEKYFVDTSITTIRGQFTKFLSQYNKLKEEMIEKNKQILNLQNEKQELFMNNNWKICELEKSKNKEIQIELLKKDLIAKDSVISEFLVKIKSLEIDLKTKDQHLFDIEKNYKSEIDRYDNVLFEYKKMFEQYQMKITNLEETLTATKFLTKDLKDNLNTFKSELKKKDMEISSLCNDNQNLLKQIVMNNEKNLATQEEGSQTNQIILKDEETITDYQGFVWDSVQVSKSEHSIQKEGFIEKNANFTTENDPKKYMNTVCKGDIEIVTNPISLNLNSISLGLINKLSKIDQSVQTDEMSAQINLDTCGQLKTAAIRNKFQKLLNRVKHLENNVLECKKSFNMVEIEKMILDKDKTELNTLLQVKTLELKEQQKKYERNYRTLLRKVREHMKGRNAAEKHNKYLQELYNNLCDENNLLKLTLSSKTHENDEDKKLLTEFHNINGKMKKEVRELEKKLKLYEICTKCVEFNAVKGRLANLELYLDDIKNEKQELENLVIEKESILLVLQQKIQELHHQITSSTIETNNYQSQIEVMELSQKKSLTEYENLMKKFQESQLQIEDLSSKLQNEKQLNEIKNKDIFTLKNKLRELEDKLEYATKEKENLGISIQALTEELQFLKEENAKKDSSKSKQYEEQDKIIGEIKGRLQATHRELSAVNSEKLFIQRLCNDLKVALNSYVNQNQILKEKLDLLSESRQDSLNSRSSLPDLPSLQSFDENLVNNLLQESRFVPAHRPLTDIQLSLDTLRKEISILQEQISRKNLRSV